jgi:hypothetical protein
MCALLRSPLKQRPMHLLRKSLPLTAAARRPGMTANGATLIRPEGCEPYTPRHSGLKFMATPLMQ